MVGVEESTIENELKWDKNCDNWLHYGKVYIYAGQENWWRIVQRACLHIAGV